MAIPAVGDRISDNTLYDLEDKEHNLKDFTGTYLLLEFWSVTCMVCMKVSKELKDIHEKYQNKVNIIGLNMDTQKSLWEQGTARDGIRWTNLSDGQGSSAGIGNEYGVFSYPAFVLVNPEGIIVDRWMGYKPGRIEEKIKEHLKGEG
ncbi:MAG: TlpA family protein disulfide reductase [Bacteroidota bacterium]